MAKPKSINDSQVHIKGASRQKDNYLKHVKKEREMNKELEKTLTTRKMTAAEKKQYGIK